MDIKTDAIVIRTVKYGDDRLIIDFLTREAGRVSAAVRMAGSKRAKAYRQTFQPLSILAMDLRLTPNRPMATIVDARLATPYTSIPFDGTKLALAFFLAEFLHNATREAHCDTILFDFVLNNLLWFDAATEGIANFHIMFMLRLSRFLGFMPDTSSYTPNAIFDMREGRFVSSMPLHSDVLLGDEARSMVTLMRMSPSTLHLFRMNHVDRNRITDCILYFYRLHIPAFGTLKSLDVLRGF